MALRGEGDGSTWSSLFVFVLLLIGIRCSFGAVNGSDAIVQPLLYFTEEPSGTVYGAHFSTLCINCSASCTVSGAVNMTWRKDDRAIVDSSQGYSISNDSLCIQHFSKSRHEGFYECVAQHQIGTLVSSKVKVEEAGISSLYVDPVDVSASVGDSIRLQCVVNATPWPDIDWLKNDQKLIGNDSRVTVLKSGVLQLVNVTRDDEGRYKCLARNSWANETSSLWATLSIVPSDSANRSAAEVLLGRPRDQVVIVSQTVVLECFLNRYPLFPITWTKQGSEIRKDARLFGSGNLEISDVNETDSGTYVCSWTNSHDGENKTAQANVTVYVPPRLDKNQSMRPYTLKRSEQVVRLHCLFSGHPVPLVTWLKDGKIVKTNNRIRVDRFELSIIQTRTSDEGIYQCRAENPAGMQQTATQLQYEINVNAPYPPVGLVATSVDSTSVQLSWRDSPQNRDRAVQAFSVHIIPPAGLEHQYVVPCKRKPCSESLKVEVLQPYTNYTIYVVAYNRQGRSKQSRKLAVTTAEDVPTRFPSLTLSALNSTSIRLSWKELSPDQAHGVITEYMIKYQKLGASKTLQIPVRPPLTEYTLTGLDPNTKYNVLVAARTEVGYPLTSSNSLPWKTSTTDGFYQSGVVPISPQMTVAVIDNTALLVNWTRSTRIQVLGYNLFCRSNGSVNKAQMEFHVTLNKDVSRHLVKDLEPSTAYQVKLVAFNSNGESVPVTRTIFTGSTVEVKVINSTAVILHWKRPSKTVIYDYTVQYCSLTSPVVNKSVTSFTESQIISELFQFTAYEFSVEARGSQVIHLGTAKCQTSEGVPSAPLDLDVSPLDRGSALIHWSPPVKQNGVIVKYIVLYTTDQDLANAYWFSQVENGTSLSTVVENLKPGVVYYFQVQAVTNAGRGPSSEIAHMSASAADTQALSDQELGIIIGTAIGVTCIIICTCVIVLHNRCRGRAVATPIVSAEGRVANGSVAHCHCRPSNYTAEFHILHSRADDLSLFDNSHQLIENSNCDSKGGNVQNRGNLRYADQNNALPLLRGKSERVCNSLDLDRIDYDNDPIVTLNNAINCAGSDKIKDCESENVIDKIACTDTVLCQNSLLGGRLPSRNRDHTTDDETAKDEKEVTGSANDSDCENSSQNNNFDDDRMRV